MLNEVEKYRRCYANPDYRCGPSRLEVGKRYVDSIDIDSTYLDVGCGRGELIDYAMARDVFALGVDLVPMLARPTVVTGSVLDLPLADNAFANVSCMDVLEHLSEYEVPVALDELFRVASHSLFLTTNDRESVYDGMDLHRTRKPLSWWRPQIERDGWKVSFEYGPPHADWQWTLRR